ncbi:MAG: ureidoglycolate lyase [Bacteroidales bacterium]|jgi:ureidoglycolate lyase|nr:ureidoglycolate lyase [Bacteroidales bacterium]
MKPVEISSIDFSDYGIFYDMLNPSANNPNINFSAGEGWEDSNTIFPVVDTLTNIGFTTGTGCPFTTTMMERHAHTQEALFCAESPIVFLVAKANDLPEPDANDVLAVLLKPGQLAVLHRNTWHSSAHGLEKKCLYYWLALCYKNEPTEWKDIKNGPVYVE